MQMKYVNLAVALFSLGFMLVQIFLFIGTRTLLSAVLILLTILMTALSFRYVPQYFPGVQPGLGAVVIYMVVLLALVFVFVRVWLRDSAEAKGWIHRRKSS